MPLLFKDEQLDRAERVQLIISYILQGIIFITILFSVYRQHWLTAVALTGILFLTFLPAIIRRSYKVCLPMEFDLITILFVFLAVFLGEVYTLYTKIWWWDVALHTSAGFLIGIGGFVLVYVLNEERDVHVKMRAGFVALFAFAFSLAFGGVWEIFEFGMDSFFGLNMQKSGLVDTMWDLIVDSIGALIIAILGYIYLKSGKSFLFHRMITRFVEKNPQKFTGKWKKRLKRR